MCSTHLEFEWTIDEVSSLNPANVEAHETQFQSIVDPEFEAKAQAAICTYFKEKHAGIICGGPAVGQSHCSHFGASTIWVLAAAVIVVLCCILITVPSPDDCPLREQKIILNKSLRKKACITRDNHCQTELTLPPILPKAVEDALRPFCTYTQNQQQSSLEYGDSPSMHAKTINESMGKRHFAGFAAS